MVQPLQLSLLTGMMIISYKMGQKYPIPYDINKIMTYLGILFSAISFYIPYVRKLYNTEFYLEYFYISSIITKRNGT
jgi:hypothetical protein